MAMRVNPRIQLRLMRKFARDQKYRLTALEGGGEREKARRVAQMLRESLRAENGVVMQFEDGTSGQDRESYSDDQDRESYTVEEEQPNV